MSPADTAISTVALEQATSLFDEIVAAAGRVDRMCYFSDPSDDPDLQRLVLDNIRLIVSRVGWMAELGLERLGQADLQERGSPERWLLSPKFNQAGTAPPAADERSAS